jgi:hypothetical protein
VSPFKIWYSRVKPQSVVLPLLLIVLCTVLYSHSIRTPATPAASHSFVPLRYLAINVGNASPLFRCWEYKLCRLQDVQHLRTYIATWKPDVILLSEVYRAKQLTGSAMNGPILPSGYTGICGESRDRSTQTLVAWNAKNASHEHECIAWKTDRLSLLPNSPKSAYGGNGIDSQVKCHYDFTGFRAQLRLEDRFTITAVAVHPNSSSATCRTEEILRYWMTLANEKMTIIGGDWNTGDRDQLQQPILFKLNYSKGWHWELIEHSKEVSAEYLGGLIRRKLDHAYSNFGTPCTQCGYFYGTPDLPFGSALGSYDHHPRADGGQGMDHRQILVDIAIPDWFVLLPPV